MQARRDAKAIEIQEQWAMAMRVANLVDKSRVESELKSAKAMAAESQQVCSLGCSITWNTTCVMQAELNKKLSMHFEQILRCNAVHLYFSNFLSCDLSDSLVFTSTFVP